MGGRSDWQAMEGWTLETTSFDFMHNVYLGGARDLIGSGIRLLIRHGMYGDVIPENMDAVLARIQSEMRKDCSKHGLLIANQVFTVV